MSEVLVWSALGIAALTALLMAWRRLQLSLAKHPSLAGHARMARRVASWLPGYAHDEERFFDCDGAPAEVAERRKTAFHELARQLNERHPRSLEQTAAAREMLPDLQFTGAYRVPYPFSPIVRRHLRVGAFLESSDGVTVTDLDGRTFLDLTGSYGVNVFGYDFYKECMAEAVRRAGGLGPVLGNLHTCVVSNAAKLREISGLDEVTFHMSGTEAVMQAVRLARYHTRRPKVVRFCGAYHGWWDDVQPGPGNPLPPEHTYTLRDMDVRSLRVLRSRRDIACVLVNPLQALHPNRPAPGDSSLVDSSRRAGFDRAAYSAWLQELRDVCTERGIPLIFDEVFLGFRLGRGGAQEYFGVKADLVTYGKTLGGGFPVGVVCGRRDLMRRFREDRPADICFARGTFNAHPYVMTAMQVFLERLDSEPVRALYRGLDTLWNARAAGLNARLESEQLPVRVANLSTVWTILFTRPSRYNWVFQYYLRAEGLALSWVGSGRLIFSLNFTEEQFAGVSERFVRAARRMLEGGWWWEGAGLTDRGIRRAILRETFEKRRKDEGGRMK
ncbi:MAG: aminotransferase class III-fold pyridoxal phosphate-dependent enzyme [Verrucomicrobiae bacterium]|nr:aminotransferase class III-fold pyridoxal phosphate-dependent enzyme [Verrucomicrobiae bacterium]